MARRFLWMIPCCALSVIVAYEGHGPIDRRWVWWSFIAFASGMLTQRLYAWGRK